MVCEEETLTAGYANLPAFARSIISAYCSGVAMGTWISFDFGDVPADRSQPDWRGGPGYVVGSRPACTCVHGAGVRTVGRPPVGRLGS